LLGHATIAITLDTCSQVLPAMGSGTADAMDAALSFTGGATKKVVTRAERFLTASENLEERL
jgi:hypothetical protein